MDTLIIGAGISGLTCALEQSGGQRLVLERGERPGGKSCSHRESGFTLELGPTGFLGPDEVVDEAWRSVGLGADRLEARSAAARRFLVRGGALREIRPHPIAFARSGILGPLGLLRMATEPLRARRADGQDESIFGFAQRRLGRQAAERMIAPMVQGVFAGDSKRLSLPAAFPKMAAMEREHGGLFKAMLARRKQAGAGGPAGPGGTLTSFRGGLQSLPLALAEHGGF